ncbi:hypothetical protein AAU01_03700 [Paenarthrobacter aurescens]|uniref:DUF4244 domain-containing protein n=1 Tax=Paenarthrobacter aurescens TaxID=43663 RepID=A0A4Y3NB50_PAEAU|nr:hypothetical protein AAU01_03700 [Paenarthrobacter aurescens]
MKTLSTPLPGLLMDMPRDRQASREVRGTSSTEPEATRYDELSEYELDHNVPEPIDLDPIDLESFDLEEETWQLGAGFEELAQSDHGPLEEEGLRTRDGFRREEGFLARVSTRAKLMGSEAGMATAEYAIATLAAVGLAGLLVVILRSEEVRGFLLNLIRTALSLP